jgi:lipopolysaccharide transport system ATP-binding protein
MNEPIIRAERISKRFIISHEPRERTLRDAITSKARNLFRARAGNDAPSKEEFYALRDIGFEVHAGDRLGIIGRNGAGKSTLLKILSRITEPTAGQVTISGRVASLLEVGTGFHPELTGRENIYLNGAILGMSRLEIRRKFDEIVSFAEVERFLDTPVKRYSSGMYVRLAFAVAAHLEPEILIVDEVLAVGDAQFQKKCLGKMEDVSTQAGRTVLFVSHNTGVIAQLCNKAMLLDRGQLVTIGRTTEVVARYIQPDDTAASSLERVAEPGKNQFLFAKMTDQEGAQRADYRYDEPIVVTIRLWLDDFSEDLELAMRLMDRVKHPVFTIHEKLKPLHATQGKTVQLRVVVPPVFITPGS